MWSDEFFDYLDCGDYITMYRYIKNQVYSLKIIQFLPVDTSVNKGEGIDMLIKTNVSYHMDALDDIMLIEIRESQKEKRHVIPLI